MIKGLKHLFCGKTERSGTFYSEEEKIQGGSHQLYKYPREGRKATEPGSFQ